MITNSIKISAGEIGMPVTPADELALLRFKKNGTWSVIESGKLSGKISKMRVAPSSRYRPLTGSRKTQFTTSSAGGTAARRASGG